MKLCHYNSVIISALFIYEIFGASLSDLSLSKSMTMITPPHPGFHGPSMHLTTSPTTYSSSSSASYQTEHKRPTSTMTLGPKTEITKMSVTTSTNTQWTYTISSGDVKASSHVSSSSSTIAEHVSAISTDNLNNFGIISSQETETERAGTPIIVVGCSLSLLAAIAYVLIIRFKKRFKRTGKIHILM